MTRLKITFALILSLSANVFAQRSKQSIDSVAKIAAEIFLKDPKRMAVSVAVYDRGKLYTYHFGKQSPGGPPPNDNSRYEIGSITKTMTGMLLAHAVVEKKVTLQDDVRKFLKGRYPNLEYSGQPIRLYQLLNHSSGLPFFLAADTSTGKVFSNQQFLSALHQVKLDTVPGIKLNYSNSAAHLLSIVLENVYLMPYVKLLSKYLFKPLKMDQTGLELSKKGQPSDITGYNGNGTPMPATQTGAAGGIRSTIGDMLSYMISQLDENQPAVALSHQPNWGQINPYAIGLNWQMTHRPGRNRTIFQTGGTSGFTSYQIMYPDQKIGVVLLSNEADYSAPDRLSDAGFKIADFLNDL